MICDGLARLVPDESRLPIKLRLWLSFRTGIGRVPHHTVAEYIFCFRGIP
jgi:hypothetical protein